MFYLFPMAGQTFLKFVTIGEHPNALKCNFLGCNMFTFNREYPVSRSESQEFGRTLFHRRFGIITSTGFSN